MGRHKSDHNNIIKDFVKKRLMSIKNLEAVRYFDSDRMIIDDGYNLEKLAHNAMENCKKFSECLPVLREFINSIRDQLKMFTIQIEAHRLLSKVVSILNGENILKYLEKAKNAIVLGEKEQYAIKTYAFSESDEVILALNFYRSECDNLKNEVVKLVSEFTRLETLFAAHSLNEGDTIIAVFPEQPVSTVGYFSKPQERVSVVDKSAVSVDKFVHS